MPKQKSVFICQNCSAQFPRWAGQCGSCGEWNTLVETLLQPTSSETGAKGGRRARGLGRGPGKSIGGTARPDGGQFKDYDPQSVVPLLEVEPVEAAKKRFSTGSTEFDRVLGGGIVPGAVMLIGGEPGIGKSTLLTQLVMTVLTQSLLSKKDAPSSVLYVCGEESPTQITLRIKRILENEHTKKQGGNSKDIPKSLSEHLLFVSSTDVDEIVSIMYDRQPALVIVDSIQAILTTDLLGAEGSVGQIRESAQRITDAAKHLSIPTFMVGHVTKDGAIAGPKVLEHIVDSVLELSGERTGQLRLLRAIKNRFGATDEVGVFKTVEYGLAEVSNPSEIFLEHAEQSVPGSTTVAVLEGTRPLLLEVQALVVSSQLAMPRRVGRGIELNRIQVLAAVLQKQCGLPLGSHDIFLSAAGGFAVREPAVDLGLAVAMTSSLKNKPVPAKTVFIGEVGLLGEIRAVSYLDQRIKEAKRLGYSKIITRQTHRRVREVLAEMGLL